MTGTATDLYEVADALDSRGLQPLARRVIEAAREMRRLEKHADALVQDARAAASPSENVVTINRTVRA